MFTSSSYSDFLTHMSSKEERDPIILPPIQTEYFLSAGAWGSTSIVDGAKAIISFFNLAYIFLNIVVPPARIMFL